MSLPHCDVDCLQCLVVTFPGHTHLLFHVKFLSSTLKIHAVSTISWALLYSSRINVLPWPHCYTDRKLIEYILLVCVYCSYKL